MEEEKKIDREILEEVERYQIEREMGNLDLQGFGSSLEDSDIRFAPEESSLDVLPHELINNASINSRDMSMISASGASSQGNSG